MVKGNKYVARLEMFKIITVFQITFKKMPEEKFKLRDLLETAQ